MAAHVRQRPADSPADLRRVVGELMSERLDRERPLWAQDLVGPLADGRQAVAVRRPARPDELRDGKEVVRTWRYRWAPLNENKEHDELLRQQIRSKNTAKSTA